MHATEADASVTAGVRPIEGSRREEFVTSECGVHERGVDGGGCGKHQCMQLRKGEEDREGCCVEAWSKAREF